MTPSDELFKLIKCLTKSEKRFFKLFSSLQSGDKNYLKIYDYLVSVEEYDECEFKKISNKNLVNNLPSKKNNLYKLILKSLRAYHDGKSINNILKNEINNIEILYNKALYKELKKKIRRAKIIAKKYEKFSYLLELVNWEKKLVEISIEKKTSFNISELIEQEKYLINKLIDIVEIDITYSKINLLHYEKGLMQTPTSLNILKNVSDSINNVDKFKLSTSVRIQSIFFYINGLNALVNKDYKNSSQFFNKTINLLNKNVSIKFDSMDLYLKTLFHLSRTYIYNREFDNSKRIILNIKSLQYLKEFKYFNLSAKIFFHSYSQEIFFLNRYGRFEESVSLILDNEKKESLYISSADNEIKLLINYNKSYSYFGIGNFKKSLDYLNNILNSKQKVRQDIHFFARLLNIIIHYELENFDFSQYLIKSSKHYFSKIEDTFEIFDISIKYFRKLLRIHDHFDKVEELENFHSEVIKITNNNIVLLNYLNLEAWLISKITNVNFIKATKNYMVK